MSDRRRASQKANEAKGGPRTEPGKKIAARNSVTTGEFASPAPIVHGRLAENPEEVSKFRADLLAEIAPQTLEQWEIAHMKIDIYQAAGRVRRATDLAMAETSEQMTHDEARFRELAAHRVEAQQSARDLCRWLRAQNRDHLWDVDETRSKSVSLRYPRGQNFVTLIRTFHRAPVWPPADFYWSDKPQHQSDKNTFRALRHLVIAMFDRSSADLLAWAEVLLSELNQHVFNDDQILAKLDAERDQRIANRQLVVTERGVKINSQMRAPARLTELNKLYCAADTGDFTGDEE